VSASRETDGDAIAINEQRYAPNLKNVVAADSLGDVMDGNVGEFLKFLPGVVPEYATRTAPRFRLCRSADSRRDDQRDDGW